MPRFLPKSKPRVLKARNVKRRTGARAQSKQISALSRQLNSMSRKQFAKVHTVWQRNMLTVDNTLGGLQCYVCPIPHAPCNPAGASQPGGPVVWTDNLSKKQKNVLWDGFLTPEGSEGVPTDLRILHDMIALLQENKIRKREVSTHTS